MKFNPSAGPPFLTVPGGGWLRSQLYKFRHGDLSSARADEMDDALPGWLNGRKGSADASAPDDGTT